ADVEEARRGSVGPFPPLPRRARSRAALARAAGGGLQEFAPDKSIQLYDRGIRRRLAPMPKNDRRRLELAFSLLFSLPGTPMMQYGEEIGMGGDLTMDSANAPGRRCSGRMSRAADSREPRGRCGPSSPARSTATRRETSRTSVANRNPCSTGPSGGAEIARRGPGPGGGDCGVWGVNVAGVRATR